MNLHANKKKLLSVMIFVLVLFLSSSGESYAAEYKQGGGGYHGGDGYHGGGHHRGRGYHHDGRTFITVPFVVPFGGYYNNYDNNYDFSCPVVRTVKRCNAWGSCWLQRYCVDLY